MGKMLFAAVIAAAALVGCSKDTGGETQPKAMSFETYVAKNTKTVPVTGNQFADGSVMSVYAYNTPTDWATDGIAGSTPYMAGVQLTKSGNTWTYSPAKYWVANKKYTFFAYANAVNGTFSNGKLSCFNPADAESQKDLMYAPPVADRTWDGTGTPSPVQFAFKHALCQVKFSLKTAADYSELYEITLQGLSISTMPTKATLDLLNPVTTWTDHSTSSFLSYIPHVKEYMVLNAEDYAPVEADGQILMMIPQALTNVEIPIWVIVTATDKGDSGNNGEKKITAVIRTGQWEANKIYNYQISLDLNTILNLKPIEFGEPTVEDWPASATDVQP